MPFKCQSPAHWKICEWLTEQDQHLVSIEIVSLNTLTVTGNLGQTLTLKWGDAVEVPEVLE